ncbi:hypothetical protein F5Y10DRAFT_271932 [Nemania abortiva]|nr:hypothetical protein F5Y10DRAFT_271932 [Nemania abortiva]
MDLWIIVTSNSDIRLTVYPRHWARGSISAIDGSKCDNHFFNGDRADAMVDEGYKSSASHGVVLTLMWVTCDIFLEAMKDHEIVFTRDGLAPRNILDSEPAG